MPKLNVEGKGEFDVPEGKRLVLVLEDEAGVDQLHACGGNVPLHYVPRRIRRGRTGQDDRCREEHARRPRAVGHAAELPDPL